MKNTWHDDPQYQLENSQPPSQVRSPKVHITLSELISLDPSMTLLIDVAFITS